MVVIDTQKGTVIEANATVKIFLELWKSLFKKKSKKSLTKEHKRVIIKTQKERKGEEPMKELYEKGEISILTYLEWCIENK